MREKYATNYEDTEAGELWSADQDSAKGHSTPGM